MNSSPTAIQSTHVTTMMHPARRQGSTTIKVPVKLRDHLKQDATMHGQTLAGRIDSPLRESTHCSQMADLHRVIDVTPLQIVANYARERDEWLGVNLG